MEKNSFCLELIAAASIVKPPSAPSAQEAHQIANRHYEEVKSSCPDSQTLKNLFYKIFSRPPFIRFEPVIVHVEFGMSVT